VYIHKSGRVHFNAVMMNQEEESRNVAIKKTFASIAT
jgi:hypothetical protein